MEKITPFDWHRIFLGDENEYLYMLEIGFRVLFIYLFTVFFMRFMGKRGNRGLSTFENVLVIALGSATGDAMFYPKIPLAYACLVIALIVILNRSLQYLQLRSRPVNTFLDGVPVVVVKHGELVSDGLKTSRVREEEMFGMLRQRGIGDIGSVEYAILERSGELSVFEYDKKSTIKNGHNLIDEAVD